ncbi:Glycerophosphodiester phosphodiesterase GDPD2, partial [Linum grandiflorum]
MLLYINNTSYPILLSSKTPNPIPKPRLIPITTTKMALKAVHVSDVPTLDLVPDNVATPFSLFSSGIEMKKQSRVPKFLVVGHRGHGMNNFQSLDPRMRAIKENTLLSFNSAARLPLDFVEFDVQVCFFFFFLCFHVYAENPLCSCFWTFWNGQIVKIMIYVIKR